jgi:hypothetical protein
VRAQPAWLRRFVGGRGFVLALVAGALAGTLAGAIAWGFGATGWPRILVWSVAGAVFVGPWLWKNATLRVGPTHTDERT